MNFTSPARNKLHLEVAQQIEAQISSWRLRCGDLLPGERRLSTELGVSRTAVREALSFLSAKGLVEVNHGKRTLITADPAAPLRRSFEALAATDEVVVNLFEVREPFEAEMAALAAQRATAEEIRQLGSVVVQMQLLSGDEEQSVFVRLDLAFHNLLAQSTHNPVFLAVLQSIRELTVQSRYRDISLKHSASCTKDHERIFLAVRDRSPVRARGAMQKHIRAVRTAFEQVSKLQQTLTME